MKLDITKIANVILYMIEQKVLKLNDKKLAILLFLIDYSHLKNCGDKIFGETYIKSKRNPQAQTLEAIFDIIINDEDLNEDDENLYIIQEILEYIDIEILKNEKFTELKFIKMEESFDESLFSKDELKTIFKIVKENKIKSTRNLANKCFNIDKVRETQNGDTII